MKKNMYVVTGHAKDADGNVVRDAEGNIAHLFEMTLPGDTCEEAMVLFTQCHKDSPTEVLIYDAFEMSPEEVEELDAMWRDSRPATAEDLAMWASEGGDVVKNLYRITGFNKDSITVDVEIVVPGDTEAEAYALFRRSCKGLPLVATSIVQLSHEDAAEERRLAQEAGLPEYDEDFGFVEEVVVDEEVSS